MQCERCGCTDVADPDLPIARVELSGIDFVVILCISCERAFCRQMIHSPHFKAYKIECARESMLQNHACGMKSVNELTPLFEECRKKSYESMLKLYDYLDEIIQTARKRYDNTDDNDHDS